MITALNLQKVDCAFVPKKSSVEKPVQTPNFTGVNKEYAKRVYVSSDFLQGLNVIYAPKNGVVGELPIEIINEVKKTNPENLSDALQDVIGVFADSARVLNKIESKKALIDIDELCRKFLKLATEGRDEDIEALIHSVQADEYAPPKLVRELEEGAAKVLTAGLKEKGILKEGDETRVKYIGSGQFGDAFSIEFQDEEGGLKFDKYVIKTYKNSDKLDSYRDRFKANLSAYSNSEEYINTLCEYSKNPETVHALGGLYNFIMELYTNTALRSSLHKMFANTNSIHAEANAAKFLEHARGGNINDTDLLKTYFFNLDEGFSLVRLADDSLALPKTHVNLERYGLVSNDMKKENLVNGRLIDYGSIVPMSPATVRGAGKDLRIIAADKVARRYYNKLHKIAEKSPEKARFEYQRLRTLAKENRIAQRTSVLNALELAKDLVEVEE